jgi:hypothetical protein
MDLDSALTGKPAEGAGATDILRADHAEVMRLFGEYDAARGEYHARIVLSRAICLQLDLHDRLEHEVFYPAVQELEPDRIAEAEREHEAMREAAAAVKHDADAGGNPDEAVGRLKGLVEAHVRSEEGRLFPQVERRPEAELLSLGRRLIETKEKLTGSTRELEGPAT